MKKIEAKIIADSKDLRGNRITSFLLTYPRFIHGELMTHRMFSRNSASSRAIPFKKMVKMVEEDPFIPIAWQKDHKGMQGIEYITDQKIINFKKGVWLNARNKAIQSAKDLHYNLSRAKSINDVEELDGTSVTKQLCNRLLEPFMWHTVLVTATEFDNFFKLRCPKYQTPVSKTIETQYSWKDLIENHSSPINLDILKENQDNWIFKMQYSLSGAEIHIQALAESMWDAMNESAPEELNPGEWHIPFGDTINFGVNVDYKITKEHDLHFHRHRIMFIVKNGELLFAPQGTSQSHTEYFGDIKGLIRGFRWDDSVYTYIDNFIPIESDIVSNYFKDLECFAGGKDFFHYKYGDNPFIKIASARCARLSYMTFDGKIDYEKDIKLHNQLLESGHFSPFEHCARVMSEEEYYSYFKGIIPTQIDKYGITNLEMMPYSSGDPIVGFKGYNPNNGNNYGWCNNFRGFIPYRYLIENC